MISRKAIALVAALAVGGGVYGIVNANSGGASGTASAAPAKVIPFQRGEPGTSKTVGQVPQGWTPGSGTVVTGTAADKAKAAASPAYPGGIVNRVVLLSNGDFNVHLIGVNWPHHVFVDPSFQVIGAA